MRESGVVPVRSHYSRELRTLLLTHTVAASVPAATSRAHHHFVQLGPLDQLRRVRSTRRLAPVSSRRVAVFIRAVRNQFHTFDDVASIGGWSRSHACRPSIRPSSIRAPSDARHSTLRRATSCRIIDSLDA